MNHSKWKAVWALLLCVLLCCTMALAEESEAEPPQLGEDIEVEGVASDEEDNVSELDCVRTKRVVHSAISNWLRSLRDSGTR